MARLISPQFVIFDFDGVLADTDQAWFSVVVEELAVYGAITTIDDLLKVHRGKVIHDSVPIFEDTFSIKLPIGWAERVIDRAIPEMARRFRPVPGSVEAIRAIADAGLPVAVASGSLRRALVSGVEQLGLMDVLHGRLVSSHDDGRHKPLPDVYLRSCALLGLDPEHGVAVEDSPTGVASASSAGLTVVGFAGHGDEDSLYGAGAQSVIREMDQLLDTLSLLT
jgi:beta-phosphoglucomutase-like phosphatase (HAD superfamily)